MPGALTSQQLTDYRTSPFAVDGFVYFTNPDIVFAARVNMADATYPLDSITFDGVTTGAYTDIESGMTITIGSSLGRHDYGIGRVKSATSSTIAVGRSSVGYNVGELSAVDNAYITVYKDYRIWVKIPYIDENGVQYKDGTIAFSDLGNVQDMQPPVANCGPDRLFIVPSSTATQEVDFDGTNSFAVEDGATITTYLWDVDDGSITSGTTGSSSITVEFTNTGERYVSLTVTDSNSNTHTARCLIVLAEESDCMQAVMSRERLTRDGVVWEIEVFGDNIPADTLPGAQLLYAQTEYWGSSSGQIVGNETRFSGWLSMDTATIRANNSNLERTITILASDAGGRLRELAAFSQAVDRAITPTNWYQMAFANVDRMIHYILYWHSTTLERVDYFQSDAGEDYPFVGFEVQPGSLWGQVQYLANAIAFRLTCNTSGQLQVVGDSMIQPTSLQASTYDLPQERRTTVRIALDEDDYTNLTFEDRRTPANHWCWAEGLVASDGASIDDVYCVAPGLSPGQGVGSPAFNKQIVVHPSELQIRTGHHYAARLNPAQGNVRFELLHGGHVIEPADMEWIALTLSSTYQAQNRVTWTTQNMMPVEVTNTYDIQNGSKRSEMLCEIEIEGALATAYTKPTPPQLSDLIINPLVFPSFGDMFADFTLPIYTESFIDEAFDIPSGTGTMAAIINASGSAWHVITTNLTNDEPSWTATDVSATITDTPLDGIVNPASTNDLIIVSQGDIWEVADANTGSPSISSIHTFAYTSASGRKIEWSLADSNWMMVVSSYTPTETGAANGAVYVDYTTDGGSSWSAVNLTSALSYGDSLVSRPLGIMMSHVTPGEAWVWCWSNPGGSTGEPTRLVHTTDYGANWEYDTFFGGVELTGGANYEISSQQSVYPYTNQVSGINKFWMEDRIFNTHIIHRDGSDGSEIFTAYPDQTESNETITRLRPIVISWTSAAIGAKVQIDPTNAALHALYTSEGLPGEWQSYLRLPAQLTDFQGMMLGSDNETIWIWGEGGLLLSKDFGASVVNKWGDIETEVTDTDPNMIAIIPG